MAQEQVKRSKIAQKQSEEDKNVPESEDEEESEEEGGKKAIAPRSWYLNINHVKVGDFVMLEVLYNKLKGGPRRGVSAAKVSIFISFFNIICISRLCVSTKYDRICTSLENE